MRSAFLERKRSKVQRKRYVATGVDTFAGINEFMLYDQAVSTFDGTVAVAVRGNKLKAVERLVIHAIQKSSY
jgi:hypothetical protein